MLSLNCLNLYYLIYLTNFQIRIALVICHYDKNSVGVIFGGGTDKGQMMDPTKSNDRSSELYWDYPNI